ncbi:hypothetical protein ASZ78_009368 [Callipepla squamata]|uniref:WD repeat-containing protein 73 n=1 Tax=Callipepla squamata TaxID=9009 RepID=A0A226MDY3_CALSU|nr:hypothetical protein ASZ78_009368 [Callipepla squamata]
MLVTSGPPDSSVQLWRASAEDSDVIKSVSTISTENSAGESWAKMATISTRAPWVLHGSRLCSTRITELESHKEVYAAGFDGSVRIYDTQSWAGAGCHAEPLFVHEGHEWGGTRPRPRVTAHAWHPHRARTLVSAATDGSLHVWDWAQPHGR